ncbi:hypothetical protein ACQKCU_03805 [Heyndrickxia sporothermodurans]
MAKQKRDKVIRIDKEAKEERNCDGTVVITIYRKKDKKMKKYALF